MANILGSVAVSGFVAPSSDTDVYPAHTEEWGRGGYRTVVDLVSRDAITPERRKEGMLVNVVADWTVYQLKGGITNTDWVTFSAGGGSLAKLLVDETTLAPLVAGSPTLVEIEAFVTAGSITDAMLVYTGTDLITDPVLRVYHADSSGTVTAIEVPSSQANPRVFMDETTVAPAVPGDPTILEVELFASTSSITDTVLFYTGTDIDTDYQTKVWHIDSIGKATLIFSNGVMTFKTYEFTADSTVSSYDTISAVGSTTSDVINDKAIDVIYNGLTLPPSDYLIDPTGITMLSPLVTGASLVVKAWYSYAIHNTYTQAEINDMLYNVLEE